jgi:hypothetical protein
MDFYHEADFASDARHLGRMASRRNATDNNVNPLIDNPISVRNAMSSMSKRNFCRRFFHFFRHGIGIGLFAGGDVLCFRFFPLSILFYERD